MDFRQFFETSDRGSRVRDIDQYIRGEASKSPLLLESVTLEELEAKEKSAREATLENPNNAFARQVWLYYGSLLRDYKITTARRTRVKAAALNGLYMENYGAAKIAADSYHTK